jgi:hypothetical protein
VYVDVAEGGGITLNLATPVESAVAVSTVEPSRSKRYDDPGVNPENDIAVV